MMVTMGIMAMMLMLFFMMMMMLLLLIPNFQATPPFPRFAEFSEENLLFSH
jgi:hypothetical protein